MHDLENDGLPPWPQMPEGWDFDPTAIVARRTTSLFIGAIVFVHTQNRVYRKKWNGSYHAGFGGPVERYCYEPRKVAGETRVSWLLARSDGQHEAHWEKVPKRDLSKVFGRDDVEDALWIGENQHKIARAVSDLRGDVIVKRVQLGQIAKLLGMNL